MYLPRLCCKRTTVGLSRKEFANISCIAVSVRTDIALIFVFVILRTGRLRTSSKPAHYLWRCGEVANTQDFHSCTRTFKPCHRHQNRGWSFRTLREMKTLLSVEPTAVDIQDTSCKVIGIIYKLKENEL